MESVSLYEKYRPTKLSQMAGQHKSIRKVRDITKRGWGGRAWWIEGASGSGKTTLAKIIARMGADEFFIEEFGKPALLMEAAVQKGIESAMQLSAWGKGGRAFIINEAHGLSKPSIHFLLDVLERIPKHVVFIFTTTADGSQLFQDLQGDAQPLLSRCIEIELDSGAPQQWAFAQFCKKIARKEGLDGAPLQAYMDLARDCQCNCRRMLQRIEANEMKKPKK